MFWWAEVCLLVALVPLAIVTGAEALHSLIIKLREEEVGFRGRS